MKNYRKISLILFCIYVIAVISLCVIHTEGLPELPKYFLGIPIDKVAHFVMFFPYIILGYSAFYPTQKGRWRKFAVLGIIYLTGITFAFATERLQAATSYRAYELLDMAADNVGLLAGGVIIIFFILKTDR